MPLPLGHAAIGLAVSEFPANKPHVAGRLVYLIYVIVLANLPDIDVIAGLLFEDNAYAFHRGPTHSIAFAAVMGFAAYQCSRYISLIPRLSFTICFSLILSHVLSDMIFTHIPVSLFWPFTVNWSYEYGGLKDVMNTVAFDNHRDLWIIIVCLASIPVMRLFRRFFILPLWLRRSKA